MKKISIFAMLFALMLLLAACGGNSNDTETPDTDDAGSEQAEVQGEESKNGDGEAADGGTVEITHELDSEPVVIEKNPEKVVVFDFGFLDTLREVGVDVVGLPQMNIPSYLNEFEDEQYENVGSLKEPDFEKIHSLQPDVIFISGRQAELYEEFKEIAPTIYVGIDTNNYVDSFKENLQLVANIFDKQEEIDAEIASIEEQITSIQEKIEGLEETALVILGTEGKLSAYGAGSRFGIIHDVFGFAQADENIEASTHGQSISFEYILETNPGILFVVDRDAAIGTDGAEGGIKETLENDLVQKTDAFQNDKIIYLNPEYWYLSGGGLVSFKEMLNETELALQ